MKTEYFPIVTPDGMTIGRATRQECHSGSKILHPVVHLHVIDRDGRIFLQQRSFNKDIQPGKWDTAVGGHVDYGEDVIEALERECHEEIGINLVDPIHLSTYVYESEIEKELINSYCIVVDSDNFSPTLSPEEIIDAKFWSDSEIEEVKNDHIITPNFIFEYERIKKRIVNLL